ncbi:MAG TPA: TonB-dependent receptor, partial [Arcobacter sp.]|nr:TonB-dependent receptor [Arcobacter sp.]
GVSFTSNGGLGATSSFNLRGSSNNRTLILIDGVKYKDHSSISGTDLAHIMITDIERIEVIKGAQSGIWGADAAAGVINIITKDEKDGTHGLVYSEYGSFYTFKYGGSIGYKNNKYDLKIDAQKLSSEGFSVQSPKEEDLDQYEDDKYENTTINVKSNINVNDNGAIHLNVNKVDALKEYDSYNNPNDFTMKNDVNTKTYQIAYTGKIKNHDYALKYESSDIKRDQIGTTFGVKETESKSSNLEFNDKVSYNQNDFVIAGFGKNKDKVNYTTPSNTKNDAKNDGKYIYATNSNTISKLIVTESLRYDNYDNFDAKTTGKIGTKYSISSKLDIFANYGTAYSVPQLIQNINPWGASNMDLKPEKSKSYDIGVQFSDLKVTYFTQKVTDLIDWYDPDGYMGPIAAIYKNQDGESKYKGIEVEYSKEILKSTLLTLNYSTLSEKDKDGKDLARRANKTLKFALDYYGVENLHLGLNGEYVGERYNSADKQGEQTGKYTVVNCVANYTVTKDIKTYIKVDNVTDKEYQSVDGYATSPRAYYAGLKYNF